LDHLLPMKKSQLEVICDESSVPSLLLDQN
jgi:hypothetical protein